MHVTLRGAVMERCFWCNHHIVSLCSKCQLVVSCHKHMDLHRRTIGGCAPFRIESDPDVGRHLVAVRDIDPGELIFMDEPFVLGPTVADKTSLQCVECFCAIDGSLRCQDCRLPICSVECISDNGWHKRLECGHLAGIGFVPSDSNERLGIELMCLTPLRLLLLQQRGEPHYDFYAHNGVDGLIEMAADVIRTSFLVSGDDVTRAVCQVLCNGKSLEMTEGTALYGTYSLLNHSCLCNTSYLVHRSHQIEVRAQRKISVGEEITTRYIGFNVGQPSRSLTLRERWGFSCRCPRCEDPTEMGTFNSAVSCLRCAKGPAVPMEGATVWKCMDCGQAVARKEVALVTDNGVKHIRNNVCEVSPSVASLEEVISHLQVIFHAHHYLVVQVKFVLLNVYGAATKRSDKFQLGRLLTLGSELLRLLDRLDPGISRNRAQVLKEMIGPTMKMAEILRSEGAIDDEAFEKKKLAAIDMAKELVKCLRSERLK